MEGRKARLKIIEDTVINSILTEMENKLRENPLGEKKTERLLELTKSKIISILNSMNEDELVPKGEFKSEQDFKSHVLGVIGKVRNGLFEDMKKSKISS